MAFRYRTNGGAISNTSIIGQSCNGGGDCYGVPVNSVRYDSPTFAGFSFSTAWGEDDIWDIGLRYAGEMHGFKLAAAISYGEVTSGNVFPQGIITGLNGLTLVDPDNPNGPFNRTTLFQPDSQYTQVGAYAQHVATGLFLLVNYGNLDFGSANGTVTDTRNSETWYFKGGIRTKCTPLGATVFYGEYDHNDDGARSGSSSQWWGLGAVQEIDAAAMSLWLSYRQFSADDGLTDAEGHQNLQDFDMVKFGALINF